MRTITTLLTLLALAVPAAAQQPPANEPGDAAIATGLPDGWLMRLDRDDADPADVTFTPMSPGWHVATGPAAIFWRPDSRAVGEYTASATIHLMAPAEHPEAYGLFIGGRGLGGANQDYTYFLVRQTGEFLVKHRVGDETHTLIDWTAHPAVRPGDPDASVENTLTIEAGEERLRFLVNGTEVGVLDRPSYMDTDGVVGLRINHRLDTHVEALTVEPAAGG
ncbi:MAG: hypothetical protein ACRELV_00965 [Longimicrobiales bacterium]